jgi:hypothetical protein
LLNAPQVGAGGFISPRGGCGARAEGETRPGARQSLASTIATLQVEFVDQQEDHYLRTKRERSFPPLSDDHPSSPGGNCEDGIVRAAYSLGHAAA